MYSEVNVSLMSDIPQVVGTFGVSVGWQVDMSNPNQPIFTDPRSDSNSLSIAPLQFRLRHAQSGTGNQNQDVVIEIVEDSNTTSFDVTSIAYVRAPKTPPTPSSVTPTKVHMFGQIGDAPFIAVAIEYGFNLYRHMYFGYLEKKGDYQGGEVIAGTSFWEDTHSATLAWDSNLIAKFLFGSRGSEIAVAESGGARIVHASNTEPWRIFSGTVNASPIANMPSYAIIGGFNDSINDGYAARGKSPFTGENVMSPCNLYAAVPIGGGECSFVPVGSPPGFRHVHMKDLEPGAQITVGNKNWRVFPVTKKSASQSIAHSSQWASEETSYYMGYAYLEGDDDSNSA